MSADWSCPGATMVLSVEAAENREVWLAARRRGIGASDAAVLMGEPKYVTEFDLWCDKTGRTADREVTIAMEMGQRMEEAVAQKFSTDYGLEIRRRGMLRSRHEPLLLANVDRLVANGYGLECKFVNQFMKLPTDLTHRGGWPAQWYWQGVACLAVTGRKGWYLAVGIGNSDFQVREIRADDPQVQEDMAKLLEAVPAWWQKYIIDGEVPPMGAAPELADLPEKDRYEFFIPEEGIELRDRIREIRETTKALKEEGDFIKKKLMAEGGGARWFYADGRPILELNPRQGRKTFMKKRFFAEDPINGRALREWLNSPGDHVAPDLLAKLDDLKMTEAEYTTQGDPGIALLIVGDERDE